jgi:two-component system CheB/CheR fusion protein
MVERQTEKKKAPPPWRPEDFGLGELFSRVPDAIIVREAATGRIVLWNPGAEAIFGYAAAEVLGRLWGTLVPSQALAPLAPGFSEGTALHKNGQTLLVEFSMSPLTGPHGAGSYELAILRDATAIDVTRRKRAECALQESESRFKAFMDAGPILAFIRDQAGRYIYTNRAHQLRFHSENWVGTTVFDHFSKSQATHIHESDRSVLETGQPSHFEEAFPSDGASLHLLAYKFSFTSMSARPLIGSVAIDVTPLKLAQDEIQRQAEALEAANRQLRDADRYKDEFLSILSHELRTPLNFIIGFASLLEDEVGGPLNQQEHEHVGKVLLGADRLLVIIDNLLEMGRIVANKFSVDRSATLYTSLIDQAVAALAPLAAEKHITLSQDASVPGEVWVDPGRIKQVLLNLLDNAIKFTPSGGRVHVRATLQGDRLVTEISDTGVGIDAQDIPKLFTRFKQLDMSSTREAGGMGLGLALSKAIVEGHGGSISVTSKRSKGSTFRFVLPLESDPGTLL